MGQKPVTPVRSEGTIITSPEESIRRPEDTPTINYSLDWESTEIIGMERAKRCLDAALSLPMKFPSFCAGIPIVRTILLWGPPGTGKTMLVQSFAQVYYDSILWRNGDQD
jgi:SpoVK/Ycf46/Vps4 family AAA+-type ATPase